MQTRANLQVGMDEAAAARRATHALGGVEQAKERCRDARPLGWANDFLQDLRYAWRSLRRTPGFTLVAVVTVALGIGANTALFSVIFAVLLRPLPFPDADRLVRLWTAHQPGSGLARTGTALPDYRVWRSENRSFEEMGAFLGAGYHATGTDHPELLVGMRITASLWGVLKSQPQLGRTFSAAEEQWGSHRVVVLSDGLWRRRFGADPQVIGRSFELNGQPHAVIGVMPPSFVVGGPRTELWTPLAFAPGDSMDSRRNRSIELLGRLKPGVAPAQAQADLSAIAENLARQFPENTWLGATMEGWQENIVGASRPMLLLLLGAVACVLLIACANVANLLLARATTRGHEMTVRATLGAGRGRLIRQLLTENLLLASLGATLGVALAYALIRTVPTLGVIGVPRLREVTMDGTVVSFAVALTLLTGLAFGIWPARHGGRIGAAAYLKESAPTVVGGRMRKRARKALIVAEVSLSFVLLVGATLLILSLQHLVRVDPGFQADHLFTATLNLPPVRYGSAERVDAFIHQVAEQVAALPGIQAAGATTGLPLGGNEWGKYFSVEGRPAPASLAEVPNVKYRLVTPDYLRAMGASLRSGRLITSEDRAGQPPVAVINETIARRFWPDADPIGARISMNPPSSLIPENIRTSGVRPQPLLVVGVVGDFRHNGQEREINPEVFVPLAQSNGEFLPTFFLVARAAGDPLAARDRRDSGRRQPARSQSSGRQRPDDGQPSPGFDGAAAVLHVAARCVRRARAGAGAGRPVRRHGLHSRATPAGARLASRPRRDDWWSGAARAGGRAANGGDRRGHRSGAGDRALTVHDRATLRGQGHGSRGLRGRVGAPVGRGRTRVRSSRVPRHARRSGGGAPVRLDHTR
jgi:putative ABC transport system permease protein